MFPYGKLDPENDWVKLATLVPWDVVEERYAARFSNNGHPAHPARMALGALLIQRRLKCSDEWLVKHVGENPYLQFFIGMKEYGPCPFGVSTLVAFRKRFRLTRCSWYISLMVDGRMPVFRARSACVQRNSPSFLDSKILIMICAAPLVIIYRIF